jgi:hypothetical protein
MSIRIRLFVILLGAVLVVITFTFPIWQPLLNSEAAEVVIEGLPEPLVPLFEQLPAREQRAYLALAEQNRNAALMFLATALGPDFPAPPAEEQMPELTGAEEIATAEFERGADDVILWATGTITIYQQADNTKLIRFEDFRCAKAPGLLVALSTNPEPATILALEDIGIDSFELGALKGNVGNQNYTLPPEVSITPFTSIVIYSRPLNLVFSVAELTLSS